MEGSCSPTTVGIDPDDLEMAVRLAAHQWSGCRLVSSAQAVEELRIRTGDFVSTDEELTSAVATAALAGGCAVLLD
jgi:hypothetical protein